MWLIWRCPVWKYFRCARSRVEDRDVHDQRVQGQPPERITVIFWIGGGV